MNKYGPRLDPYLGKSESYFYAPARSWIRIARIGMYIGLFRHYFKFDSEFRFDRPGLETKYACEAAEKVGAKVQFVGAELDSNTRLRLAHETRFNLFDYLVRRFQYRGTQWAKE